MSVDVILALYLLSLSSETYSEPFMSLCSLCFNPFSANPTKWSNTLKQFVGKLALKVLNNEQGLKHCHCAFDKNLGFSYDSLV